MPFDRASQERRAKRAEKDLATLGKVNPLALEEFAALEERYNFLATQLEEQAPGLRLEVRVANDMAPVQTPPEAPIIRAMQAAAADVLGSPPAVRGASYYTDASVLAYPTAKDRTEPGPVPTVIFGPGDDRLAHQPNEWVDIRQVLDAARCYVALARRLLG